MKGLDINRKYQNLYLKLIWNIIFILILEEKLCFISEISKFAQINLFDYFLLSWR